MTTTSQDEKPQGRPKGRKVPEFSPIFPDIRVSQIGKLEVQLEYRDSEGNRQWAEVKNMPPHASWEDIADRAGGGFFKVSAKSKKMGYMDQDQQRIDGPPKFLNEVLAREAAENTAAEDDDEDYERDDLRATLRFNGELMKQHSDTQARTLEALANAVSAANDKGNERAALLVQQMAGLTQQMQNMATLHAAALSSMQQAHAAEVATYVARVEVLEKKLDELTNANAGYLRAIATASAPEGMVKAVKEIGGVIKEVGPSLPKLVATAREVFGGNNAAPKQLGEGAAKKLQFGG